MGRQDTPQIRAAIAARTNEIEMRAWNWCVWKVAAPIIFILTVYPFYRFTLSMHHPYARAFAHGDLILLAAILLFEVSGEIDGCRRQSQRLRIGSLLGKLFAVTLVAPYWMVKHAVVTKEHQLAESAKDPASRADILETLSRCASFSFLVIAVVLIFTGILVVLLIDYQKSEELRDFGIVT